MYLESQTWLNHHPFRPTHFTKSMHTLVGEKKKLACSRRISRLEAGWTRVFALSHTIIIPVQLVIQGSPSLYTYHHFINSSPPAPGYNPLPVTWEQVIHLPLPFLPRSVWQSWDRPQLFLELWSLVDFCVYYGLSDFLVRPEHVFWVSPQEYIGSQE